MSVELPLEQWVEVLRFLRLSEMMYTCSQFRGSGMKYKAAREDLFSLERGGFFWYLNSDDHESSSMSENSDCADESSNSLTTLGFLRFCDWIQEVTASAAREMECETVLHVLEEILGELKRHGCPAQPRLIWHRTDDDMSLATRQLEFKVDSEFHRVPMIDITWQCNSSAGKWCTFVSGFMSSSLLDRVLMSFLCNKEVSVQGQREPYLTHPTYTWEYAHRLRLEVDQTSEATVVASVASTAARRALLR